MFHANNLFALAVRLSSGRWKEALPQKLTFWASLNHGEKGYNVHLLGETHNQTGYKTLFESLKGLKRRVLKRKKKKSKWKKIKNIGKSGLWELIFYYNIKSTLFGETKKLYSIRILRSFGGFIWFFLKFNLWCYNIFLKLKIY